MARAKRTFRKINKRNKKNKSKRRIPKRSFRKMKGGGESQIFTYKELLDAINVGNSIIFKPDTRAYSLIGNLINREPDVEVSEYLKSRVDIRESMSQQKYIVINNSINKEITPSLDDRIYAPFLFKGLRFGPNIEPLLNTRKLDYGTGRFFVKT